MSKLVDLQRLAKLAQMLDARMKAGDAAEAAKIAQEILDRKEAVKGVQDQLDALAGSGEGSVVEQIAKALQAAKDYADEKDTADKTAQAEIDAAQDKALEDEAAAIRGEMATEAARVNAKIAADIATESALRVAEEGKIRQELANEAAAIREEMAEAHEEMNGAMEEAVQGVQDNLNEFVTVTYAADKTTQSEKDAAQDKALEDAVAEIEKAMEDENKVRVEEEGKLAKAIKDEEDRAKGVEGGFETRIAANEAFVAAQPAIDAEQDRRLGVIEASMGEGGALESRVAANEAAIEVINGTGEGSIKKAVSDLVNGAPEAMDTLKELADEIAANEGVYEAYVAQHAKDMAQMKKDLQDEIDGDVKVVADELAKQKDAAQDGTLANQIKVESERAVAKENEIAQALADEKNVNKEGSLAKQIKAVSDSVVEQGNFITTLQEDLTKEAGFREAADTKIREDFAAVDTAIRQEMAAEATRVNEKIAADIAAESALRQAAEQKVADDAKQMLADVVSSLNLEMVDNKLKLSLGKDDAPIEIAEVSLNMATDADIEAIFNNIDNPQA